MNSEDKNQKSDERENVLTPEDDREIELFIQNSQGYCQKVYGGKTFRTEEIHQLRQEIKDTNEAVKKVRTKWEQG